MVTLSLSPKIDAYVQRAPAFAQPILTHLRHLVHESCPQIEETIKWSRPFFVYRGVILFNMSAFKEHCSFGFWGSEMAAVLRAAKVTRDGMGSLDRITSLSDLPSDKRMGAFIRQAAAFVDNGQYTSPMSNRSKVVKELPVAPPEFMAELKKNKQAAVSFEALSPSCKREYLEWIADAKRPETRDKRIATSIEWIAEGKQRNWKYQSS
jgi:uncharacterized protein YdeI (YjbR/CyaY-like superfamily)